LEKRGMLPYLATFARCLSWDENGLAVGENCRSPGSRPQSLAFTV
jgi:hypothetical protein